MPLEFSQLPAASEAQRFQGRLIDDHGIAQ
jgi:hypothetical protein